MWSFDNEENKQGQDNEEPKNTPPESPTETPDDNFAERDPFSRGGNFYGSHSEPPESHGKPPKQKKGGAFLAILVCAAIVLSTAAAIKLLGNNMSLGGILANRNTTAATTAPLAPDSTAGTQGNESTTAPEATATQGTAPAITAGTNTVITPPAFVNWDPAVVERCLNASVLITVENKGSGSGVIYTADGYILTNYHVVSNNSNKITVTLFSGEELNATYIYGDESNDISVIKIEKSDCVYAVASATPVTYMMPIMVIGNAHGKGFNTTQGVVSAPASEVYFSSTYETMTLIRIDAAVNSGNSGGGLFNTSGELVGIVNAKLSGTSSSGATIESMSYAIPMSSVMKCVNDLNQYGYVRGVARLGVSVQNYLTIGQYTTNAIVVQGVTPGGSAAVSGIREKDIIHSINGETMTSFETLKKMLTAYSVGDEIEVVILRPTASSEKQGNPLYYMRECEEIKIRLTFVEFDPNK